MVSDPVADGNKPYTAGSHVANSLKKAGFAPLNYEILADDAERVRETVEAHVDAGTHLIVTVGGTGIGPKDRVVETVEPMLTTPMPGLMEAARAFGQRRTPYAVLSRGVSGFVNNSLVLTFPGSRTGSEETLAALLPSIIHVLEIHERFAGHAE